MSRRNSARHCATLRAVVERYSLERGIAKQTTWQLLYAVRSLETFLGREPTPADLADLPINRWLAWLVASPISPHTAKSKRRGIMTIWRYAAELRLCRLPERVRPVKAPREQPIAWTREELSRLLAAASLKTGTLKRFRAVKAADYWRAYILVGYYSGLRLGDLLALRFDAIEANGCATVIQAKTGMPVTCHMPPDAIRALDAIRRPAREVVFGIMHRATIQETFRWLVRSASLKGSTKRLRSSGATWLEATNPGGAMAFLGHRTPGLAYRHYVDPRMIASRPPTPPRIS